MAESSPLIPGETKVQRGEGASSLGHKGDSRTESPTYFLGLVLFIVSHPVNSQYMLCELT